MADRYIPEIGDVVEYEGKCMTIVRIKRYQTYNIAYLLDFQFIQNSAPLTIRAEELIALCKSVSYEPKVNASIPFKKLNTLPIKVKEVSYIKIQ